MVGYYLIKLINNMIDNKNNIAIGIKKARGMLEKILIMLDNNVYCADIANQINAAQWLLKEANKKLLKNHLKCCGKTKLISKDKIEVEEFINELVRVRDVSTRK